MSNWKTEYAEKGSNSRVIVTSLRDKKNRIKELLLLFSNRTFLPQMGAEPVEGFTFSTCVCATGKASMPGTKGNIVGTGSNGYNLSKTSKNWGTEIRSSRRICLLLSEYYPS
jgi:hypothetical protein